MEMMENQLSLNIWSILFLIISGQGLLLFTFIILKKSSPVIHKILLGSLIISFSVLLIYYAMYWSDVLKAFHPIVHSILAIGWAIGPITLLHLKRINSEKLTVKHLLHFIPFLVSMSIRIADGFFYFSPFFDELGIKLYSTTLNLQFCQVIIYAILIFIHKKSVSKNHQLNKIIALSYAVFVLGNTSYYLLVWGNYLRPEYDYIISFFMALSIYFIGYYSQLKTNLNSKLKNDEKYARSLLPESLKLSMARKLDALILDEKIHLVHDISLDCLSQKLNASKHDTSQLINNHYQMKFFEFINHHRVEYAKQLLSNPEDYSIKINDLAVKCGFNNKVTFNNAFKKSTGMTASQFRSDKKVKL